MTPLQPRDPTSLALEQARGEFQPVAAGFIDAGNGLVAELDPIAVAAPAAEFHAAFSDSISEQRVAPEGQLVLWDQVSSTEELLPQLPSHNEDLFAAAAHLTEVTIRVDRGVEDAVSASVGCDSLFGGP